MKHKFGLLPKVLLAIALGIVFGLFVPEWFTRIALTFNNIFGNFLNFVIPLLILGLVAPGIADLGSKAGRLLVITAALAYAFTLFSGFGTFFTSFGILPRLLGGTEMSAPGCPVNATEHRFSYFSIIVYYIYNKFYLRIQDN